jgi:hypothetical protein
MQEFIWFDDVRRNEKMRVEMRMPKPLVEFLDKIAEKNEVSRTALVTGILAYAIDADRRQQLRIEHVAAVRVTEARTDVEPFEVPVPYIKRGRPYGSKSVNDL